MRNTTNLSKRLGHEGRSESPFRICALYNTSVEYQPREVREGDPNIQNDDMTNKNEEEEGQDLAAIVNYQGCHGNLGLLVNAKKVEKHGMHQKRSWSSQEIPGHGALFGHYSILEPWRNVLTPYQLKEAKACSASPRSSKNGRQCTCGA